MTESRTLSAKDREFFHNVSESVFTNPFEPESLKLSQKIAGRDYGSREQTTAAMVQVISKRLEYMAVTGRALSWRDFSSSDQDLIRIGLLYDAYHQSMTGFDQLIVKQIQTGTTPVSVPFAPKILELLKRSGFTQEESLRYFAFFYQLRRAWYFIHHGLIGNNPSIMKLRSDLWRSIFTSNPRWYERFLWNRMEDFSTFLVGETGTGKGTAAAAIGRSGFIPFNESKGSFTESFTSNFIEINLSQFPESLLESELFGHRKGAFTGAVENHKGILALCSPHGSIFLDEIGEVSIPVQIKLLKVLEERKFTPVGDHDTMHFSGRIIAATNKPLITLLGEEGFRNDFYYRLCSNIITVPPLRRQLREASSTLEILLDHMLQKIVGEQEIEMKECLVNVLQPYIDCDYPWPGNVRELEQAVRQILLTRKYKGNADYSPNNCDIENVFHGIENEQFSGNELLSNYCALLYNRHNNLEEVARITQLDRRTVKKYLARISHTVSPTINE